MTKTIEQSFRLAATPDELFDAFLDSRLHSTVTGAQAKMNRKAGGKFTAWNGQLIGRNLAIVPKEMIVQTWRSIHWKVSDPDSILILRFSRAPQGGPMTGQIDLAHVGVPEHDHKGVTLGWRKYYWDPWKKYLAEKSKR
jgi:activator of HSP90 ATPase